jgi:hypothetical protein
MASDPVFTGGLAAAPRPHGFAFALVTLCLAALGFFAATDSRILSVAHRSGDAPAGLLDTAVDRIAQRPFDELASLRHNVQRLADDADGSAYRMALEVVATRQDLLEIQAVLFDECSGREVDRLVTYCSRPSRPQ